MTFPLDEDPVRWRDSQENRLTGVFPPLVVLLLAASLFAIDQVVGFLLWSPHRPLLALLVSALAILAPVLALHGALGIPLRAGLGLDRPAWRELLRLGWMVAAAVPVTYALSAVSSRWFPPQPGQFDLYRALIPTDWKSALGGFVAVVVFVPLAEEMLFRRLILDALRRWLPGWIAAMLAGGLFGLAHGAPWMFLPITVLGTLLGWLVVRTESLTLAWLGHGLFNLVAYVELCSTHDVRAERLERWSASPVVWLPCLIALGGWIVAEWRGRKATLGSPAGARAEIGAAGAATTGAAMSGAASAGTATSSEAPAGMAASSAAASSTTPSSATPSSQHDPGVAMDDSRPSKSNDPLAGGNDAVW